MRLIVLLVLTLTVSIAVLSQQRIDIKVREDMFAGLDCAATAVRDPQR